MGDHGALLLDTHVWIWLINANARLSPKTRAMIEEARHAGGIRISPISVWEVAMLDSKGRVQLGMECLEWVRTSLQAPGVALAPLGAEATIESTRLPGIFHGDPADRLIIATARHLNAQLITADEAILRYAAQGFLRAIRP